MKSYSFVSSLTKITCVAALALGTVVARAGYNPVALTPGSYTYAIVIPSNAAPPLPNAITATAGSGTTLGDNTYYEMTFRDPAPFVGFNSGIPAHGTVFTNLNNANMSFVMPPSYVTNNDLMIVNGGYGIITNGTLTFASPVTATSLAFLTTGGNNGCTFNYYILNTDGTTNTSGSLAVPDWFNGTAYAWGANGRITYAAGFNNYSTSSANSGPPYLYGQTVSVSNATPIGSVLFTYKSGSGVDNIYGISSANGSSVYTPIRVSGFNIMCTVPAYIPWPLTATMDNGTNLNQGAGGLGNTWFEAGYYASAPSYGLPPSGSQFASQSQPSHIYQMGNYSTNCAVLVDTNHKVVNIVPQSPAPFTGYAFLTAGASIGSGNKMTNICILQHMDGVQETNLFYGYDWFDGTVPAAIAYSANGRVEVNNHTLNNIGNIVPYMFESYFTLSDITSPVTNIVVKFGTAPANNSTTYIMAISATTNPVPPLITSQPSPATQTWYPSQSATISVVDTGSLPITNTWLIESNGVYVPLANGPLGDGAYIYGATTTSLLISNLTLAEGTNYEFIAANAASNATSSTAAVIINTGTPVGAIIDSQTPTASYSVLTNHPDITVFSVTVDATTSPPIYYQWYSNNIAVPGATSAAYNNTDTNNVTLYCIVSNFVSPATSSPITVTIVQPPALTPYQSAIMAYSPVAFWPLEETNGTIAFDYAGTNDGVYIGAFTLGNPGLPTSAGIGANVSAGFDGSTAYVDIPGAGDLNITTPITIVQFLQCPSGGDTGFTTSLGHGDSSYRLDVSGGQVHFADPGPDVTSVNTYNDGNFHQLVGVYDGTNQFLYVDGQSAGSRPSSIIPSGGQLDVTIAAAPDYIDGRNFQGQICQVAVIARALTSNQVAALYYSLDLPPTVSVAPQNPSIYAGNNITFTATANGSPTIKYQWYYLDTSLNSNNITGATNATYTLSATPVADNGYTYGVIASNPYGTNTASTVLTVQNGPAFLQPGGDISPLSGEAYAGAPVTYTVIAGGSSPLYYQWTVNGTNIIGGTNATITFPTPCGTNQIQVGISNSASGGASVYSSMASLIGDSYPTNITFNTNGVGWQGNTAGVGSVPSFIGTNVLELTDDGGGEAASEFYTVAQYVGSFTASYIYQAGGSLGADGACFILQNSAAAASALGGGGGELGYTGITNSAALQINIYSANGVGITVNTNGETFADGGGSAYGPTGNVQMNSGDPIYFTVTLANGILTVNLSDPTIPATYTTNYVVGSLVPILGGTDLAYIGFSGGDGGLTSAQTITDFQFHSVIPPVSLSVSRLSSTSVLLSWPAGDPSYTLLQSSSVTGAWTVGPAPTQVGSLYEVTVNITPGNPHEFYRLERMTCP